MSKSPSADFESDNGSGDLHHEETDINARAVLWFGAGLVAIAVVIHLSIWLLFQTYNRQEAQSTPPQPLAAEQPGEPPEPRLQTTPRLDLKALRAEEAGVLENYAWVDRSAGIVRIPINEAMKLVLQRGLPVRDAAGTGR